MVWLVGLSLVIGLAASIEDVWRRRVSNITALTAFVSGVVAQMLLSATGNSPFTSPSTFGVEGLWKALLGSLIGFGVFLIFFLLGGMGGGDIKLMAGFGAILGPQLIVLAAIMTALVGGLMALGYLLLNRARRAAPSSADPAATPLRKHAIPYAPAITLGVLLSFLSDESFSRF